MSVNAVPRNPAGSSDLLDPGRTELSRTQFAGEASLEREWLVTNGLGGFACGTLSQANTPRYHGLLIASLRPPVDRVLETGTQLTWMDAKIGDWVVTPRIGKAVELNALWHYALVHMAGWARQQDDARTALQYEEMARQVVRSFEPAFWFESGAYLYDVVDTPEVALENPTLHVDTSLRPNQIFAVSLGTQLLSKARARAVVDVCAKHLLTPVGLRSLAAHDPRYASTYTGGPRDPDAVYHQGTVWSWLLGPYVLAHHRIYGDAEHALALLSGLAAHLDEGCLGTVSEIFDGASPHPPRGCFAQAWSVSETLRAWHVLNSTSTVWGSK